MTTFTPHINLRRLSAVAAVAAGFAVPASAGASEAPTVHVEVREASITVNGADGLGRGPVRLRLSGETLSGSRTVAVVELEPGVTRAEVERFANRDEAHSSGAEARAAVHVLDDLERFGRLVAGGRVSPGEEHVTTITARAREHLVIGVGTESEPSASFRVGEQHNGTRLPRSELTIGLRDKGFYLPSLLPSDGVIRIANQGLLPHQATAYRLKATASYREAVRAATRGRFLERFGTPTVLTGLVSGGAVNRVEVDLRPGRYLVVSEYTPFALGARSDVDRGLVATTRVG